MKSRPKPMHRFLAASLGIPFKPIGPIDTNHLSDEHLKLLTVEQLFEITRSHWPYAEFVYGDPSKEATFAASYGATNRRSKLPTFQDNRLVSPVASVKYGPYLLLSMYEPEAGLRLIVHLQLENEALRPEEIACIEQARAPDETFAPVEDDNKYVVFRIPVETYDVSTHNRAVFRRMYRVLAVLWKAGYISEKFV